LQKSKATIIQIILRNKIFQVMLKQIIGENAGIIWQILYDGTDFPFVKLQKLSGIPDRDFYMAIGWLARENKIHFFNKSEELHVCLVE
jgi:hypothetical protein